MFVNYSQCNKNVLPEDIQYFSDLCIDEDKCLPEEKPPMERLIETTLQPEVKSIKLVDTPIGFSNAGQNLTGNKLVLEIALNEMCKYVVASCEQPVYIAYFENSLKSVFIVVPDEINGEPICNILRKKRYKVNVIVEEIDTTMIDCRRFNLWASILVYITFF